MVVQQKPVAQPEAGVRARPKQLVTQCTTTKLTNQQALDSWDSNLVTTLNNHEISYCSKGSGEFNLPKQF